MTHSQSTTIGLMLLSHLVRKLMLISFKAGVVALNLTAAE